MEEVKLNTINKNTSSVRNSEMPQKPIESSAASNKSKKKRAPSSEDDGKWNELYEYVRTVLFKYPKNIPLSQYCVRRLKGLAQNKYICRNNQDNELVYGHLVVKLTAQLFSKDILYAFDNVSFNNEQHKVNYMMKILESHINDVALLEYKKQHNQAQLEQSNQKVEKLLNEEPVFHKKDVKQEKKWVEKYNDLW